MGVRCVVCVMMMCSFFMHDQQMRQLLDVHVPARLGPAGVIELVERALGDQDLAVHHVVELAEVHVLRVAQVADDGESPAG